MTRLRAQFLRQSHCEGLTPVNFVHDLMALSGSTIACDTTSFTLMHLQANL
jgi:hypothetical protein